MFTLKPIYSMCITSPFVRNISIILSVLVKYYTSLCLRFVVFMYSTLPSHLKVHGHSPVCSLFSNKGERHMMVPSSWFIDYDLFSLR